MKTSKEMTNELLKRRGQYQQKRKQTIQTVSMVCVVVVLCGFCWNYFSQPTPKGTMESIVSTTHNDLLNVDSEWLYQCENIDEIDDFVEDNPEQIRSFYFEQDGSFELRASMTYGCSGIYYEEQLVEDVFSYDGLIHQLDETSYWSGWEKDGVYYSLDGQYTTIEAFESALNVVK